MGENKRRPVGVLNDLGHGKGLAGPGDAEQDLVLFPGRKAFNEFFNGARLIAAWLVGGDQLKVHCGIIQEERK